ncbi:hypothetical protein JKF63_01737 [Porcisia hertigi]|uniref:DNA-directed DNA polymerase n=1 Tax=Porcisia hertigi TaxID=2761500 RepID=A0A836HZY8_9TRYP|nr:hypothetical protein JKF63_01737 [Porcisia hertigi]
MDPFQRTADATNHAFRVVPMTHLTTTGGSNGPGSAWAISSAGVYSSSVSGEPLRGGPTAGVAHSHTTAQVQPCLLQPLESEEMSQNVLKWRQFGLQIGVPSSSQSAVPLPQRQQPKCASCHRPDQSASATCSAPQRQNSRLCGAEEKSGSQFLPRQRDNTAAESTLLPHTSQGNAHVCAWPTANAPPDTRAVVVSRNGDELVVTSDGNDDDDDEHGASRGRAVCQQYTEETLTHRALQTGIPALAPATAPRHTPDTSDDARTGATLQLQIELGKLAKKVQESTEEQRCKPPKCKDDGKASWWTTMRFGGKKRKRDGKTTHHNGNEDEVETSDGSKRNETGAVIQERGGLSSGAQYKPRARKQSGSGTGATTEAPLERGKRKTAKRGGGDAVFPGTMDPPGCARPAPQTLFSLNTSHAVRGSMAEVQSGPTTAAMASVPYIYLQYSSEGLFSDVRRALNDPDRIQAPPLFVGVSVLSGNSSQAGELAGVGCSTNFTYHRSGAKTAKRRASCVFFSLDPTRIHQHMELVFVRWKEKMYALPAQTVGLAFLCRILTELPGVELITFNAQVLLVALLAYCKGTLWSHCISDVRVMAWMAQLHVASALSKTPSAVTALVGGGSAAVADGTSDADMSVLCDYEQLLLHVCGGKPLPTVQLETVNDARITAHAASSSAESTKTAATAPVPPLTPAQRQLAQQVYYLATVYRSLYGLLGSKGLLQAFLRQEKRIALLLALMKYNGMRVDLHEVHRYQMSCEAEMARQRALANSLVPELGKDFNIQSHDQCRKAIYEVLQLGKYSLKPGSGEAVGGNGLTITKGGRLSTAEDTLRALAHHHEFPACLLRYRKVSKLMQTYIEGMMSYAVVRTQTQASLPPCCDNTSTETEPEGVGETQQQVQNGDDRVDTVPPPREAVEVNDDNPFVDCWLQTGSSGHSASSTEPPRARNQGNGDEETNTTLTGEVKLPARGYATLHPNFLQEGTDTGRLSCVEPNLQNLPRNGFTSSVADNDAEQDSEEDLLGFRRCFVAADGFVLLSIDYQQIELRVLAHLCGDTALVKALTASTDIHRTIAEVVFKKKPVSSEERSLAKRVVFGVLYGAGPKTLATHMGVTVDRALHITSLLKNAFPGIDTYHRRVIEESRANGFVRTLSGRLRYLPDICSTVLSRRSHAERQAFNSAVQGSAADVMKMAMLAVSKEILQRYHRSEVSLLSQIHDEMVFMVRKELLQKMVKLVSSAMSHAMQLLVPLSVTVKFGTSLGNLQEWTVEHELGLEE